ncbi:MAG: phosphate/phosphite/phosphonate ABC transporter substrate-binding protein [Hyphomicrobiales bacterium]
MDECRNALPAIRDRSACAGRSIMTAIAQLTMYDLPEIRAATDALWRAVAARLRIAGLPEVPSALSRHLTHHESWRHEGLLLGQACGYPALNEFRDALRIVATPLYDAPGCEGRSHRSFIVVPASSRAAGLEDLRGARFALNSSDSNTGMNLARLAFAPFASGGRFLGEIVETGGHARSLALLARNGADAAAIDCVTHALLVRHRPELVAATRILAWSAPSPSLPFVTAHRTSEAVILALRQALASTLADPALAWSRQALFLAGVAPADEADYAVLLDYELEARQMGYARLG